MTWKTYLRWHVVHAEAPFPLPTFVDANFDFYRKYLRGVTATCSRAGSAACSYVDRNLGEALGQVFVAKTSRRRPSSARWP